MSLKNEFFHFQVKYIENMKDTELTRSKNLFFIPKLLRPQKDLSGYLQEFVRPKALLRTCYKYFPVTIIFLRILRVLALCSLTEIYKKRIIYFDEISVHEIILSYNNSMYIKP